MSVTTNPSMMPGTLAQWLTPVPFPIFGAALGLIGASLLIKLEPSMRLLHSSAHVLQILGLIVLIGGLLIHLARSLWTPQALQRDLDNPAVAPFLGQVAIGLLLTSEAWHEERYRVAAALFVAGAIVSVIVAVWCGLLSIRARFALGVVSPAWLVVPIAWLYVALLAPRFELPGWVLPSLVAGTAGCVAASVGLALRIARGPALPPPAQPGLAIALAPPGLLLLWIATAHPQWNGAATLLHAVSAALLAAGILGFALVLLKRPFSVSWWAFGMPLIALVISLRISHQQQGLGWEAGVTVASWLCLGITLLLCVQSVRAVWERLQLPASRRGEI